MQEYFTIGKAQKPHGVRGALKVLVTSEHKDIFEQLTSVLVRRGEEYTTLPIRSASSAGESAILTFDGINSREAAEELRDASFCIRREDAPPLPEGAHYICDLIGCTVQDQNGKTYGVLKDVLQHGAADVYVVEGEKEILFPALKKLLLNVDTENRTITVDAEVLLEVCDL